MTSAPAASRTRSPRTRATSPAGSVAHGPGTTTSRAPAPRSTGRGSSSSHSTARPRARSTTRTSRSIRTSVPCAATTGAACASRRRSRRARAARTTRSSPSDAPYEARASARPDASSSASARACCRWSTASTPATASIRRMRSAPGSCRRKPDRSASARLDDEELAVGRVLATVVDDVELAARVLAEGADGADRASARGELPGVVADVLCVAAGDAREAPDEARAEVAVEVPAAEVGHPAAAVHEPAGDRAPARMPGAGRRAVLRVAVLEDRRREPARVAPSRGIEAVPALHATPAVVHAGHEGRGLHVDLFPAVLSHVGDVEVAGGAVEAVAPRVAEALREGDGCLGREVDAEELPEPRPVVLSVVHRIAGVAAVAHADVEEAVRAERVEAAVVVRERLRDREEDVLARRIGRARVRVGVVAGDDRRAVARARVVHVEEPVLL